MLIKFAFFLLTLSATIGGGMIVLESRVPADQRPPINPFDPETIKTAFDMGGLTAGLVVMLLGVIGLGILIRSL